MIWFHLVFGAITAYLGYHVGGVITLSDLWPYFEALRTTTSIVFGIMGALLAVVFPEVLKQGFRGSGAVSGANSLRRILVPCANSAILLIVLVALAPGFAWIKATTGDGDAEQVQRNLFCLFCLLTYWQVIILQMTLLPMDILMSNTVIATARDRLRRAIHLQGRG
jgi:hypothetical protein